MDLFLAEVCGKHLRVGVLPGSQFVVVIVIGWLPVELVECDHLLLFV